jgi:hypothetical protein
MCKVLASMPRTARKKAKKQPRFVEGPVMAREHAMSCWIYKMSSLSSGKI